MQVLDDVDLETVQLAQLAQGADVTGVAVAEPGVGADHDGARVQRVDEHALHEALGRPLRQLVGERHDQRGVQPGGRHQVQPLVQAGDQLGRPVWEEHLHRVRVEGDRHRGRDQRVGALHDTGQHGAVPGVHTVEVAQGDDRTQQVGRDVVQVVPALHGGQRTAQAGRPDEQAIPRPSARLPPGLRCGTPPVQPDPRQGSAPCADPPSSSSVPS